MDISSTRARFVGSDGPLEAYSPTLESEPTLESDLAALRSLTERDNASKEVVEALRPRPCRQPPDGPRPTARRVDSHRATLDILEGKVESKARPQKQTVPQRDDVAQVCETRVVERCDTPEPPAQTCSLQRRPAQRHPAPERQPRYRPWPAVSYPFDVNDDGDESHVVLYHSFQVPDRAPAVVHVDHRPFSFEIDTPRAPPPKPARMRGSVKRFITAVTRIGRK